MVLSHDGSVPRMTLPPRQAARRVGAVPGSGSALLAELASQAENVCVSRCRGQSSCDRVSSRGHLHAARHGNDSGVTYRRSTGHRDQRPHGRPAWSSRGKIISIFNEQSLASEWGHQAPPYARRFLPAVQSGAYRRSVRPVLTCPKGPIRARGPGIRDTLGQPANIAAGRTPCPCSHTHTCV